MIFFTTRRNFVKALSLLPFVPSVLYGSDTYNKYALPHIGFLVGRGSLKFEDDFTGELKKLGYSEGINIHIEQRLARPNTSDGMNMAAELAQMDLRLIVAGALPFALEIRKNNPNMPMVLATCPGMVSNGFAKTLEQPGGIYTGMDELPIGITAKRIQLLLTAAPGVTRIGLLSTTPGMGGHEVQVEEAQKTAAGSGIEVKSYRATSLQELEKALETLVKDGMNGMVSFQGGLAFANRQLIVDFANRHRLPAVYQATDFAELGGLMAWAPELPLQFREAARYVDKILKGARPGDLPVKQPEKYYLTLNAKAAGAIGLDFPKELLDQAVKVIR